jgi:hypothetical protein
MKVCMLDEQLWTFQSFSQRLKLGAIILSRISSNNPMFCWNRDKLLSQVLFVTFSPIFRIRKEDKNSMR